MARRLKAQPKTTPPQGEAATVTQAPAAGSNVTEQTKRDFVLRVKAKQVEMEKARDEMRSATNRFRAELKAAKQAGVATGDILWVLAQMKRDPEEVTREINGYNEMARIMNLPIGAQLGLFADGETVATKVDKAKLADPAADISADQRGYEAAKAGKTLSVNPYDFEGDQANFDLFEKGWARGVAENVTGTENGVVQALQH